MDRDAIVDSDAETLCALAAAVSSDDALTHQRWLDLLSRESLSRRFYRALEKAITGMAGDVAVPASTRPPSPDDRRALALLYASRLLFLAFLEAKGWLDGDRCFLGRTYENCLRGSGDFHRLVLRPLFFGTLNTPPKRRAPRALAFGRIPFLNGGLFGPTPLERRLGCATFSDESFGALLGQVLCRYRFTAREDRSSWSEAAVDPEMLGKAFESLMAPAERHATGAYYTPQSLVERVTQSAIMEALATSATPSTTIAAMLAGEPVTDDSRGLIRPVLTRLRVLDPACGSGAFLVYALETLATLAGRAGDARPSGMRRRAVLTRSIFGVDVNPTAVWLCELRLWLAVVIETEEADPVRVLPLPNLDRNVRIGDALAAGAFGMSVVGDLVARSRKGVLMGRLRDRYARASGANKSVALRAIERAERARAIDAVKRELAYLVRLRLDAVSLARGRDLFGDPTDTRTAQCERRSDLRVRARALRIRLRALEAGAALPFAFAVHFADADADGGFDAVIGNPPWVRPHEIPDADRQRYRREFHVCRQSIDLRPFPLPSPGSAFGVQVDLAAVFVERGIALTRPGGVVAMLLPAKLWRSLAGAGVRRHIGDQTHVLAVEDWPASADTFDATVFPSMLVARRRDSATEHGDRESDSHRASSGLSA
jgi:hypothetical protein